jgi:hypothetical protein
MSPVTVTLVPAAVSWFITSGAPFSSSVPATTWWSSSPILATSTSTKPSTGASDAVALNSSYSVETEAVVVNGVVEKSRPLAMPISVPESVYRRPVAPPAWALAGKSYSETVAPTLVVLLVTSTPVASNSTKVAWPRSPNRGDLEDHEVVADVAALHDRHVCAGAADHQVAGGHRDVERAVGQRVAQVAVLAGAHAEADDVGQGAGVNRRARHDPLRRVGVERLRRRGEVGIRECRARAGRCDRSEDKFLHVYPNELVDPNAPRATPPATRASCALDATQAPS